MSNKPRHKVIIGSVGVAVWSNTLETANGIRTVERVTIDRRYKDSKTGEWKSTGSFNAADLPKMILALQKAYEFLVCRTNRDNNEEGIDGGD